MCLQIRGPGLPNLTLIDLPGIVHVAGISQDREIVSSVKEMVHRYIQPSNVIILVVLSAESDLATNIAIVYAEEVDPEGKRTIGERSMERDENPV
jgi:hypothetical protein